MNIIPISGSSSITPFKSAFAAEKPAGNATFQSVFEDAVSELEHLNQIKEQDAYDISLGNIDDIAAAQINSQKAEVALQLLVQTRNKILDAYQEIMRISV